MRILPISSTESTGPKPLFYREDGRCSVAAARGGAFVAAAVLG